MRCAFLVFALMAQLLVAVQALAQELPPDVVRTASGDMVRGLIVERVQGQYVVIRTASGDLRRVEERDIVYAGPSGEAPAAPAPSVPPPSALVPSPEDAPVADYPGDVPPDPPPPAPASTTAPESGSLRLRITSDPPRLTLVRQTAEAFARSGSYSVHAVHYEDVCTAPCDAQLAPGSHEVALREPDGTLRAVSAPMNLSADSELHLGVESRRAGRAAMISVGLGLAGAGAALLLVGLKQSDDVLTPSEPNWGLAIAGGVGLALGATFVIYGPMLRDRGRVEVRPYAP